jgi:hypothetical protein
MRREKLEKQALAFKNPNKAWVTAELEKLHREWLAWGNHVATIEDHPYNKNTQAECYADGVENMQRHDRLREKTLVFLDNNIQGHNFMQSQSEGRPFENNVARLRSKVPHRIHELEILRDCLQYALVPEGFWKEQGKKLVKRIADVAPEKAADIAASYLRNPVAD